MKLSWLQNVHSHPLLHSSEELSPVVRVRGVSPVHRSIIYLVRSAVYKQYEHGFITYRVRLHLVSNFFVHILHALAAGRTCKTRCL